MSHKAWPLDEAGKVSLNFRQEPVMPLHAPWFRTGVPGSAQATWANGTVGKGLL